MLKQDASPVDIVKRFDRLWDAHSRMCANGVAYWSVEPLAIPLVRASTFAGVKWHNWFARAIRGAEYRGKLAAPDACTACNSTIYGYSMAETGGQIRHLASEEVEERERLVSSNDSLSEAAPAMQSRATGS